MPAHRSDAEADIRTEVVAWLRSIRPNARIIHEINASDFGNRIDVMAVDLAEIISVEIKSERDKMDRAPAQIKAMQGCSHHVFLAAHRCHLAPKVIGNPRAAMAVVEDIPVTFSAPPEAKGAVFLTWPKPAEKALCYDARPWGVLEPKQAIQSPLPSSGIDILWRDELALACRRLGVSVPGNARMATMVAALRWNCSGSQITKAICRALRERDCVEADPRVVQDDAA